MKYSIGTNLDNNLIIGINKLVKKYDIDKKNISFFGGFPGNNLSLNRYLKEYENIKIEDFFKHILFIIKSGYKFVYLLNSLEINLDRDKKEIDYILKFLYKVGVNELTVANLDLIEYINKNYNNFLINVSTVNKIHSIEGIKQYLGFKSINKILLAHPVNYNMVLLKEISGFLKDFGVIIELVGNEVNFCDLNCKPCIVYEHFSKKNKGEETKTKIYNKNGKKYSCCGVGLNPLESTVIIPEVINIYNFLGVKSLKISSRMAQTKKIIELMNQYFNKKSKGNLYDLLGDMNGKFEGKYFDTKKIYNYLLEKYKKDFFQ